MFEVNPKIKKFFSNFSKSKRLTVFVTVGSTNFDKLIEKITSEEVLNELTLLNVTKIILQIGNSELSVTVSTPIKENKHLMDIHSYKFKDSIKDDIECADIIIGHAGAGTCLEVLRLQKRLLVVTNDELMDSHQSELAETLTEANYILSCKLDESFMPALRKLFDRSHEFESFPNNSIFESIIDKIVDDCTHAN